MYTKEEEPINIETQLKMRKKLCKRKKLRRLNSCNIHAIDNYKKSTKRALSKRQMLLTMILSIVFFLLLGHQLHVSSDELLKNFLQSYRRQYHQILHGRADYCEHALNTQQVFKRIQEQRILHQEAALQQLEQALHASNESLFSAFAIVGPSGVGKSLWARAFAESFPWRDNVHSYAWNTYVYDEAERFHIVRLFLDQLSDCGSNLLIVDNLQPCDNEVARIMNELILTGEQFRKPGNQRVLVIYIFNLNTMEDSSVYLEKQRLLQRLPHTQTIYFKPFDVPQLKDCIRREASMENVTLSEANFNEIVATIEPSFSGCKNVHSKVMMFGKRTAGRA